MLLRRDKSLTIDDVPTESLEVETAFKHPAKFSELEERMYEATNQMCKTNNEHLTIKASTIRTGKVDKIIKSARSLLEV